MDDSESRKSSHGTKDLVFLNAFQITHTFKWIVPPKCFDSVVEILNDRRMLKSNYFSILYLESGGPFGTWKSTARHIEWAT